MSPVIRHAILKSRSKGVEKPLAVVIGLILGMVLLLAVVPMVVSGANDATSAAQSCPDWMSKISDLSDGSVDLC